MNRSSTNMTDSLLLFIFVQILVIQCELIKDPTLKPAQPFSAEEDAETIRKELKSVMPNRDKIAGRIFHRTYEQRKQIEEQYNQKFCSNPHSAKCPLHSALGDVSDENLDKLYDICFTPPEGILAKIIFDSIEGKNNEEGAIEEVVCANDNEMKDLINKYYQTNYQKTVEEHLATFKNKDTEYQHVMLNYCWKGLCQNSTITPEDLGRQVQALQDISPEKDKTGFKKKLTELLDRYCEPDLKLIFQKFRHDNRGIGHAVGEAFKVDREERAYRVLVRYIKNVCRFYAKQLDSTMNKVTTLIIHFHKINRIVLTRCERDLHCILKEYHDEHHRTFTNRLKDKFDSRYVCFEIWPEYRYLKSIRYLCGKP